MAEKSKYGKLGLNVGLVGRWSRLVWGLLILFPVVFQVSRGLGTSESLGFYATTLFYIILIALGYTLVYWLLGERLFAKANPWVNTLILVGPAFIFAWWNILILPIIGFALPGAFVFAWGIYIGVSFIIQWKIKYGGCEVVAVPILLFKKRYTTYCIPLVAIDAVEKAVVDRIGKDSK